MCKIFSKKHGILTIAHQDLFKTGPPSDCTLRCFQNRASRRLHTTIFSKQGLQTIAHQDFFKTEPPDDSTTASCDRYRCHARGAGNGCEPCFEKILVCNRPEALFWKNLSVRSSGGSVSKKNVVCNRLETMFWQNLTHFTVARMTCLDDRRLQRFFF